MIKLRTAYFLVVAATVVGLAAAQNAQVHSTTKSSSDSHQTATKPLTPKSAMPAHRKSSGALHQRRHQKQTGE